jgi:hypothetical protein
LLTDGEKPNGYDVFNATNNFLASVAVAVPQPQADNGEYLILTAFSYKFCFSPTLPLLILFLLRVL